MTDTAKPLRAKRSIETEMLQGPPMPVLIRLATPSAMAFLVQASVSMSEVAYVGQLGMVSLAALAIIFPLYMLTQMLAGGATGGGVASAIARALGAGDREKAEALVWHAIAIAVIAGLAFSFCYFVFSTLIFRFTSIDEALGREIRSYGNVLFSGVVVVWLTAILSSVLRGTGNMRFPSFLMIGAAIIQVPLSGMLILGWFGLPRLGLAGGAASVLIVSTLNCAVLLLRLYLDTSSLSLNPERCKFRKDYFADILKVALPASISPVLSVATVAIMNGLIASFGAAAIAGYGIVARLEFLIIPMVFGLGAAMTAMVGINVGAGQYERAEKIGWTGGLLAAGISGVAGLFLAIFPGLWVDLFTDDPAARSAATSYLRLVGPAFAFQGLGLSLFFASQGAGNVKWPVMATILRFVVSVIGATLCVHVFGFGINAVYGFITLGMVLYGTVTAASISLGAWRRQAAGPTGTRAPSANRAKDKD